MQSQYNLVRQVQGSTHFARVLVETTVLQQSVFASDEFVESGTREDGYVQCGHSEWVEAAVQGARSCAETFVSQGKIVGVRVAIIRVLGTECDTRPEDAWCAAALATWQALNPDEPLPTFEWIEGKWRIDGLN